MDETLFVSTEVHKRNVTLNNKEVELYFKEIPAVEFRRYFLIESGNDIEQQAENMARLISISLCNPDGTRALTLEKAKTLTAKAMIALFKEVLYVNQQGDDSEGKPVIG